MFSSRLFSWIFDGAFLIQGLFHLAPSAYNARGIDDAEPEVCMKKPRPEILIAKEGPSIIYIDEGQRIRECSHNGT